MLPQIDPPWFHVLHRYTSLGSIHGSSIFSAPRSAERANMEAVTGPLHTQTPTPTTPDIG
jgi:hypothetical protein